MALSRTAYLEVRYGGNDLNAGYFNPAGGSPGTDYSLQDSPQVTIDGATVTAAVHTTTTQINITGVTVSSAWNRNGLRITGGTATAGLYEITAVDVGNNRVTVDRSAGTAAQTVQGRMGGALATAGQASALINLAGAAIMCKYNASDYLITSVSSNVSGGCVTLSDGVILCGYDTTRSLSNTDANKPTFKATLSATTIFGSADAQVRNVRLDGDNQTTSRGFHSSFSGHQLRCEGVNLTNGFIAGGQSSYCKATGCSGAAVFSGTGVRKYCVAMNNTVTGFSGGSNFNCMSLNNTGATSDGFTNPKTANRCVAYGNGRDGFRVTTSNSVFELTNCASEGNTGYGYQEASGFSRLVLNKCADHGNTARSLDSTVDIVDLDPITGGGSLFTNAAGGDFSPAAALKGVAFPSVMLDGTTANYEDVGAAQAESETPVPPDAGDIREGVVVNGVTGTNVMADPNYYLTTGPGYGEDGTEYDGLATLPAAGDVDSTAADYGVFGSLTDPTLVVPAEEDVLLGVDYGAGGTEFEGTADQLTAASLQAGLDTWFAANVPDVNVVEVLGEAAEPDDMTELTIADAVWDELLAGHATAGSAGATLSAVPTAATVATAVWANSTRVLTAGTNIALAKGTGVTGFNDLDAAGVRSAVGLAAANLDAKFALTATATSIATLAEDVTLVLEDTGTTIPTTLATLATASVLAAVQAKTDNLPTDPADHSLIMAAIAALPSSTTVAASVWSHDFGSSRTAEYFQKGGFSRTERTATTFVVYDVDDTTPLASAVASEDISLRSLATVNP